jgi:predicted RNA-binding protein YlqC (UPF0109 family)
MSKLTWSERVNVISINPVADKEEIARLAGEHGRMAQALRGFIVARNGFADPEEVYESVLHVLGDLEK